MKPQPQRLPYLDWVRGLAALTMLQGHVFQSFLAKDLREGGAYRTSQFAGGMPPAVFLFILGITFAFLLDSQERKGVAPLQRWVYALKRSGFIFAAAFAFRIQLWSFSMGHTPWTDIFKVDILNCMGLSLFVFSLMAFFRTRERIRNCAVLGIAIAAAAPLISNTDFSGAPAILRDYLVPSHAFFGFFPWAAFVALGMSMGSILRLLRPEAVAPAMQWFGWGGLALAFAAYTTSSMSLSVYPNSDFWLNSPALVFIKTGVVMILIAFSWVWNIGMETQWSWIRQFGLTSLLVYWVHIEFVYGDWFGYFKERLTVGETVFAAVLTIIAMLGLSLLRTNWTSIVNWTRVQFEPQGRRVSGD